jgi:hypothetical protein
MSSSIETLDLTNCPNVSNIDYFNNLNNLRNLRIENCRDIQTLKPLKELKNLKEIILIGNTRIVDGDMTPLQGVNKVFFPKKYNHYSHNFDEL